MMRTLRIVGHLGGWVLGICLMAHGGTGDRLAVLPDELLERMHAQRPEVLPLEEAHARFLELLYPYPSSLVQDGVYPYTLPSDDGPAFLSPGVRVHREQALEDVDALFHLFKYSYAGYQVFGGDAAFGAMHEDLRHTIEDGPEHLFPRQFSRLLAERLSSIQDGHIWIDARQIRRPVRYSLVSSEFLLEPEAGQWWVIDGEEERMGWILSVNGADPADFVQPTIADDGRVIFRFGVVGEESTATLRVLVQTDDEAMTLEVSLNPEVARAHMTLSGTYIYLHERKQGIPWVKITSFVHPYAHQEAQLATFVADAATLAAESCLILDLRGNSGGLLSYPHAWIGAFTGSSGADMPHQAVLATPTAARILEADVGVPDEQDEEYLQALWTQGDVILMDQDGEYGLSRIAGDHDEPFGSLSGWMSLVPVRIPRFRNNTVIAVLIDKNTASAAEWFISHLSVMDNVVLIGHPTAGTMNFARSVETLLPNSRLPLTLPLSIMVEPLLVVREGVGHRPDLWVNPDRALEAAVQFLQRYFADS